MGTDNRSSMGNNRGMNSVSNDGSVGNHSRGMGNNRVGTDKGSSVSNNGSMGTDNRSLRGDRGSLIGDIGNKSKLVISMVGGGLDSAVRKVDGEGSSNVATSILGLSLSEVGSAVVITHSVLVGKGLRGLIIGSRG